MFFVDNDVSVSLPTGYGKSLIYLATPVINRLSSLEKSFAISTVPPVKALAEDQVHYLNVLGLRRFSAFNVRSFLRTVLRSYWDRVRLPDFYSLKLKLVVSYSDSLDWEKSRSFFTLAAKLSLIFIIIIIIIYLKTDAELQIHPKNGEWIHFSVVVYLNNLHANTCHFAKKYFQMTLFCIH